MWLGLACASRGAWKTTQVVEPQCCNLPLGALACGPLVNAAAGPCGVPLVLLGSFRLMPAPRPLTPGSTSWFSRSDLSDKGDLRA